MIGTRQKRIAACVSGGSREARTMGMTRNGLRTIAGLISAAAAISSTGCLGMSSGPNLGIFGIPIPVSPYFQHREEEEFSDHERYDRVPIMGPVTSGDHVALDPPSDHEVIRALEKAIPTEGGVPLIYERQRNNVRIVKEKIADYIDPPRHYPVLGPAQLHHAHYKCTVYFSDRQIHGWPVPHTLNDERVEVLYIDHNHLHMVGNVDCPVIAPN
jgi:hypothetical protein